MYMHTYISIYVSIYLYIYTYTQTCMHRATDSCLCVYLIMYLCASMYLFENNCPELAAVGFHKPWFCTPFRTGYTVIDSDGIKAFFDWVKNPDLVPSEYIVLFADELHADAVLEFRGARERCNQPAVTHSALAQVCGFYFAFK